MQFDGGQGVQLQENSVSRAAADAQSNIVDDDDAAATDGGRDQQQTGSWAGARTSKGRPFLVDALLLFISDGNGSPAATGKKGPSCLDGHRRNLLGDVLIEGQNTKSNQFVCLPLSWLY